MALCQTPTAKPLNNIVEQGQRRMKRLVQSEPDFAKTFGHHLLAGKGQQSGYADHCQPQDAWLLEPVPSAALAE